MLAQLGIQVEEKKSNEEAKSPLLKRKFYQNGVVEGKKDKCTEYIAKEA